ncbi:hypothetical protein [Halorussus salinus]|uniref:hypothetical protein n=1 Tax=Halorussus salinus TaxID=1364935 RepID=UPI001091AEFC|nr:hypothetical protein [Halorussus salinus]
MGVRNAPRTILRFVAAVTALYFLVALALLVLAFPVRGAVGLYPVPEAVEPAFEFALLVAVLLGAWVLVEEYSIPRLFGYTVSVWALFYGGVFVLGTAGLLDSLLSVSSLLAGGVLFVIGAFAFVWSYRLVYPDRFARQKEKVGLEI